MKASDFRVPGWDTYPVQACKCNACGQEFSYDIIPDSNDADSCPYCGSSDYAKLYISFPTNGPGFQEGYDPAGLVYGGGAAKDDPYADIAGLPLNTSDRLGEEWDNQVVSPGMA